MKFDFQTVKEIAGREVSPIIGYGVIAGAFVLALVIGLICAL